MRITWLSTLRTVFESRPAQRRHSRRIRRTSVCSVERLEPRILLSAVELIGTVLTVTGTSGDDTISVSETGADLTVSFNGVDSHFTPGDVTEIDINANDGTDGVTINSLANGTVLNVDGGVGNDTIQVSSSVTTSVTLHGGVGRDTLVGGSGDDFLYGDADEDNLNGGEGSDTLTGGTEGDTYTFDAATTSQVDTVVELAAGGTLDTLDFSALTTAVAVDLNSDVALATMTNRTVQTGGAGQAANIEGTTGGSGNDTITGNAANNYLYGNAGDDHLIGNDGDDQLTGDDPFNNLVGGNDTLEGGKGVDHLIGHLGNDILDGGADNDFLFGGEGDDRYVFHDTATNETESIGEFANQGNDTLDFSNFTSPVTVDLTTGLTTATTAHLLVQVFLTDTTTPNFEAVLGGSGNDHVTGNGAANFLYGNGGNDTLLGAGGDDFLQGDAGNDVLDGGTGTNTLLGGADNDYLNGGTDSDIISGGAGDDYLYGNDGIDTLNGNEGSDTLSGGANNDTYIFDNATVDETDTVSETDLDPGDLLDFSALTTAVTVNLTSDNQFASMSHRTIHTAGAGQAASFENVTGGSGNDVITGNALNNVLTGNDGQDTLLGGTGNDTLVGGLADDWLNGGDGNDSLTGGGGNDVYAFSDTATNETDTVVELSNDGTDLLNFSAITSAVTANLTSDSTLASMDHRIVQTGGAGQAANFENVFGGSANDVITGNALNNLIYGNGGNDTLSGGDGSDQLDGGQGNDLLKGGNQDDYLIGGIGDDYLKGEAGNDFLAGGDGFNTLVGGTGNDYYLFAAATVNQVDTVVELGAEGTDTLNFAALTTPVTANLTSDTALATMDHRIVVTGAAGQAANFENLYGGSGNDQITGNAANNILLGNDGNDTISGGSGNDVLIGGTGNDTLKGISGQNILIGGAGGDLLLGGTGEDMLMSGSTNYDTDPAVLQLLLTEWSSVNVYQTRIDHLLGTTAGGANGPFTLTPTTAHNDANADYLTGGSGRDWFLADSAQDVVTDKAVDEVFTQIDTWL